MIFLLPLRSALGGIRKQFRSYARDQFRAQNRIFRTQGGPADRPSPATAPCVAQGCLRFWPWRAAEGGSGKGRGVAPGESPGRARSGPGLGWRTGVRPEESLDSPRDLRWRRIERCGEAQGKPESAPGVDPGSYSGSASLADSRAPPGAGARAGAPPGVASEDRPGERAPGLIPRLAPSPMMRPRAHPEMFPGAAGCGPGDVSGKDSSSGRGPGAPPRLPAGVRADSRSHPGPGSPPAGAYGNESGRPSDCGPGAHPEANSGSESPGEPGSGPGDSFGRGPANCSDGRRERRNCHRRKSAPGSASERGTQNRPGRGARANSRFVIRKKRPRPGPGRGARVAQGLGKPRGNLRTRSRAALWRESRETRGAGPGGGAPCQASLPDAEVIVWAVALVLSMAARGPTAPLEAMERFHRRLLGRCAPRTAAKARRCAAGVLDLQICAGISRKRSGGHSRNHSWKRCGPRSQAQAILGVTPSAALWAAPGISPGGAPGLAPEPKAIFLATPESLRGALLEAIPVSPQNRRRADWRSNFRRSPRTSPGLELPRNHCAAEPGATPGLAPGGVGGVAPALRRPAQPRR
jgi:hypothetical protein